MPPTKPTPPPGMGKGGGRPSVAAMTQKFGGTPAKRPSVKTSRGGSGALPKQLYAHTYSKGGGTTPPMKRGRLADRVVVRDAAAEAAAGTFFDAHINTKGKAGGGVSVLEFVDGLRKAGKRTGVAHRKPMQLFARLRAASGTSSNRLERDGPSTFCRTLLFSDRAHFCIAQLRPRILIPALSRAAIF